MAEPEFEPTWTWGLLFLTISYYFPIDSRHNFKYAAFLKEEPFFCAKSKKPVSYSHDIPNNF